MVLNYRIISTGVTLCLRNFECVVTVPSQGYWVTLAGGVVGGGGEGVKTALIALLEIAI